MIGDAVRVVQIATGEAGAAGERGYEPARRVVGRKRHPMTDTDGRLLVAGVSPADLQVTARAADPQHVEDRVEDGPQRPAPGPARSSRLKAVLTLS